MSLWLFTKRSYHGDRVIEAGETLALPDDFIPGDHDLHMVNLDGHPAAPAPDAPAPGGPADAPPAEPETPAGG